MWVPSNVSRNKAPKMKPFIVIFLGSLLMVGCHSFKTISLESGPSHPAASAEFRYVTFRFNLNVEKIDIDKSYAISPGDKRYPGQRYKIDVEPNVGTNAIFKQEQVDANVYLIKPDGSRLKTIGNGVWLFHFVVETNGTIQSIDQRWRVGSTAPTMILGGG